MGRDNMGMFAEDNRFVNFQIKERLLWIHEKMYLHMDQINERKWYKTFVSSNTCPNQNRNTG